MTLRVFVIDDSSAVRTVLGLAINRVPDVRCVGSAASGEEALAALSRLVVDLVIVDQALPGADGVTTLGELRRRIPALQAVMLSAMPPDRLRARLEDARLADVDVLPKPDARAEFGAWFSAALAPRLSRAAPRPGPPGAVPRADRRGAQIDSPVVVVLIAASTGGPDAIRRVLELLPPSIGVPVLVVQHMPATFTGVFAASLDGRLPWTVVEARPGDEPAAGRVYIAPGGAHLEVHRAPMGPRLTLTDTAPLHGCRPAADRLFLTAAEAYGSLAVAAVLTGMGRDGADGALALRARGVVVLAQDRETSTVWGMPGAVVGAGAASAVLPLDEIGPALERLVVDRRRGRERSPSA
jgi:two-component system chemotaxis response regulator CheB